jgi:hypothetical protein
MPIMRTFSIGASRFLLITPAHLSKLIQKAFSRRA